MSEFVDLLLQNTVTVSLPLFRPELALCVTMIVLLLTRVLLPKLRGDTFYLALFGCGLGLYYALPWQVTTDGQVEIFSGMLIYDKFTVFFRAFLLFFAMLLLILTRLTGIPDHEDAPDFYTLVLGATLGMCVMASANHLLMVFMGVEMASVPSYAMAGLLKGRKKSSEAALKYAVFGAGAAGVMLYGISLLAGLLGSCHIPTMAQNLATMIANGVAEQPAMVLVLGGLMTMVGLAFKLSAVPFHFWCPDVFEGASVEVNAFLSIASKAAALALTIRLAIGFGFGLSMPTPPVPTKTIPAMANADAATNNNTMEAIALPATTTAGKFSVADAAKSAAAASATTAKPLDAAARVEALAPVRRFLIWVISIMAMVTCTFGNLVAYAQTNMKRLLAYSTIAHAGYMMMPIAAGLALAGINNAAAGEAIGSIPFYLGTYLFMNLAALTVVAFLRNQLRTEEFPAYAGLIRVSPGYAVCLSLALFSLIGLPPLAGFVGKFLIFSGITDAARLAPEYSGLMIALLVVAGVNTAISLYYYLRVVKIMTIDPLPEDRPTPGMSLLSFNGIYLAAVTAPILAIGIFPQSLLQLTQDISKHLLG